MCGMDEIAEVKVQLLSIEEVRDRLGGIGRTTVWKLIGDGDLRRVKIGARSLVLESSLVDYVAGQVEAECGQRS